MNKKKYFNNFLPHFVFFTYFKKKLTNKRFKLIFSLI